MQPISISAPCPCPCPAGGIAYPADSFIFHLASLPVLRLPLFERYVRFPCSVLRFATSATLHQGRSERVSASDVAGVTAAAHDCFRIVIINFSFISLGLSRQAPPPSSPLGHLLRQPDRPSASCSSASKYESPFVVPCSGGLSSSRAAVAMHFISSVHVVDFASPSKCLPCTPVLAQRLSLSAT